MINWFNGTPSCNEALGRATLPRQTEPHRSARSRSRGGLLQGAAIVGVITVALTSPSQACVGIDCITHPVGEALSNGGKALGEVVSLGEIGRQRDRERAEAAAREAQIKADDAKRQRADRINSTNAQITTLNQIVATLDANKKLADDVWTLHDKIVTVGQAELAGRARAAADAERAADATRKSREELTGLNNALTSLSYLDGQLGETVNPQQAVATDSKQALEVARQLLRTADLDAASNGLYLDRAVRSLKTDNLKDLIAASIEARSLLVGLRSNLTEQLHGYSNQLAGKQKELASL